MFNELTSDEPLASRRERAQSLPESLERDLSIAVLAALLSRRDEAENALRRVGTKSEHTAAVAAFVALSAGDPTRAFVASERAEDPLARALCAESLFLLGRFDAARQRISGSDHPLARIVAAELDVAESAPEDALSRLADLQSSGVLGARIRRTRAEAWLACGAGGAAPARNELSAAVWALLRIGGSDELGRCYLAMAQVEAAFGGSGSHAAQWLARAHPLLARAGTRFDQERLRRAFRRLGRRAIDRLVDADLERLLESVRREHAHALDLLAARDDARDASRFEDELRRVITSLGERQEELIGSLESVLVDKERTGQLVSVCREVFEIESPDALDRQLPRLSLALGAEAAALYREAQAGTPALVSSEGTMPPETALSSALREALEGASGAGIDMADGRISVVAIRASEIVRALAIRRGVARLGRVSDDAERLAIFGSVVSAAYERAKNAAALKEAAARDAATLEAIREGVLTLDREGRVRSINSAAAALLGVSAREAEDRRLAEMPGLSALAEALHGAAEDEPVTLAHADVLLRKRHYAGGVVATLEELGKARQLAHKLVGSTARFTFEDLVGADPTFLDAVGDAQRVAATDLPILITGESGTGQELFAQAIHNASPRSSQPFIGINVAAIPRDLLESELFGYEAGAFTGARAKGHPGKFELADRGTLLLDEIGEMPVEMQAKLLRILQERTVVRLGGTREIPVRARLIATTHRDLEEAVEKGSFRLDLFYRLRVVHLRLPPLRERPSDVRLLIEHQLAMHARRTGRKPIHVAPHVREELERYEWPGNVRELANLIEGAASLLPPGQSVITEPPALMRRTPSTSRPPRAPSEIETLDVLERRATVHALAAFGGNVAQAAKALGISRGTLYNKMARWGLR